MFRNTRFCVCLTLALFAAPSAQAQTYSELVLADNPAACYQFSETTGIVAADSSVNGNNAAYVDAVQLNQPSLSGLGSSSLGLDGVSAHVLATGLNQEGTTLFNSLNFTLETWINTTSESRTGTQAYQGDGLIWSDVGGSADDFVLAALNNRISFFTGNPDLSFTGNTIINDGNWHHVVATRNVTAVDSTLTVWVDGIIDASGTTANTGALRANANVVIGGNTLDRQFFNGRMDEVALYNSVLSADSILTHYQWASFLLPAGLPLL